MFEEEAEEYRKDLKSKFFLSEPQLDLACQGFKDGYNKANEWHYVKDGVKDSMTVAMESTEAFVGLPVVAHLNSKVEK